METKVAYQFDAAGLYQGETVADASPLEPGVFLLPARCTFAPPPKNVPGDRWPRWNGVAWVLARRREAPADDPAGDPVERLRAFLAGNPDVAALLSTYGGADDRQLS